jgi:ribosomal protein S12 methylthiotransferase
LTLKTPSVHIISLGCAKNSVDSDSMAVLLERAGYHLNADAASSDFIVVNTCGFIGPAKAESISVLREMAETKKPGQSLIAAGCLTQRYGQEVFEEVPGVDGLLGTRRWMDILQVVHSLDERRGREPVYHIPDHPTVGTDEYGIPRVAIQGASAYLKIADGCRRPCAFCAIPSIKGTAVSRPMETILAEARDLQAGGVREINLIAQDTTDYGYDLGMKDGLSMLVERIVDAAPGVDWIRLLYAYPGYVTDRLIEAMSSIEQFVRYLDMPLQHSHRRTLLDMRRPANMDWVRGTIRKMRDLMPDIALRTTFIVGYPGETEEAFDDLLEFVEEVQFDRVGVFTFSFEPGTASENLGDPIPEAVKEERRERLMTLQQQISLQRNQRMLGKRLRVLIEGCGDGVSLGRSYRDAPEIDGMVIVEGEHAVGDMLPVRVTGALVYDLTAVPLR